MKQAINMIWANESGKSFWIFEGEHGRRIIQIRGVVDGREEILAEATIEAHNRDRMAEAIAFTEKGGSPE